MRLQQLTENSGSVDIPDEYLDKFNEDVADVIRDFVGALAKAGLKDPEMLEDADSDSLSIVMKGKFLEAWLVIHETVSNTYAVEIQLSLPDDISVGHGKTLVTEISSFVRHGNGVSSAQDLKAVLDQQQEEILKMNESLIEWYFDLSSHYGKVLLYVETRGPQKAIRALAGEFNIKANTGEVFR